MYVKHMLCFYPDEYFSANAVVVDKKAFGTNECTQTILIDQISDTFHLRSSRGCKPNSFLNAVEK